MIKNNLKALKGIYKIDFNGIPIDTIIYAILNNKIFNDNENNKLLTLMNLFKDKYKQENCEKYVDDKIYQLLCELKNNNKSILENNVLALLFASSNSKLTAVRQKFYTEVLLDKNNFKDNFKKVLLFYSSAFNNVNFNSKENINFTIRIANKFFSLISTGNIKTRSDKLNELLSESCFKNNLLVQLILAKATNNINSFYELINKNNNNKFIKDNIEEIKKGNKSKYLADFCGKSLFGKDYLFQDLLILLKNNEFQNNNLKNDYLISSMQYLNGFMPTKNQIFYIENYYRKYGNDFINKLYNILKESPISPYNNYESLDLSYYAQRYWLNSLKK